MRRVGGLAVALVGLLCLSVAARGDDGPIMDPWAPGWPDGTAYVTVLVATDPGAELTYRPEQVPVDRSGPVRVVFENVSTEPHNLVFGEGLAAASRSIVAPGTSAIIDLVSPGAGSYRFSCSVHEGMVGDLVVGG